MSWTPRWRNAESRFLRWDEPFTPGSDVTNGDPQLLATADLACRAALQLVQIIRVPQLTILQDAISVRKNYVNLLYSIS